MSSLREQIVDAIVTALQSMSVANGYTFDWYEVQKVRNKNRSDQLPIAIVSYTGESKSPQFSSFYAPTLDVEIAAIIQWDEESDPDLEIEDLIDQHVTDIERAILAQNDASPRLGIGAVENIVPLGHSIGSNERNDLTAVVRYGIKYRHNLADPRSYN